MKQLRFIGLLIRPSVSGGLLTLGLSAAIMLVSGITFLRKSGILYSYIFGQDSPISYIESSRDSLSLLSEAVFNNAWLNNTLLFVFWVILGLIVYMIASGIGGSIFRTHEALERLGYVHARKAKADSELVLRTVLRAIFLLAWVAYGIFFVQIFLPFSVYCAQIAAGQLETLSGWLYGLLGFGVLVVSLHLHVIMLRLVALRPRLFGGWEDQLLHESSNPHLK